MTPALLISFAQFTLVMAITPGPNNTMLAVSAVNFGFRRTLPHMAGVALGFPLMFITAGIGIGSFFYRYPGLFLLIKMLGLSYLVYMAWQMAQFTTSPKQEVTSSKTAATSETAADLKATIPPKAVTKSPKSPDPITATETDSLTPASLCHDQTSSPPAPAASGGVATSSPGLGRETPFSFWEATAFQWLNPKAWTMVLVSVSTFTSTQSTVPLLTQIFILASICLLCSIPSASSWAYFGARIAPLMGDHRRKRTFNRLMAILMVSAVGIALVL